MYELTKEIRAGIGRVILGKEDIIRDLKEMESRGTQVMTCGTCLNHYGIADQLKGGTVTNMYDIVEKMTTADLLVRP